MRSLTNFRLTDGQQLELSNVGNTHTGTIRMDGTSLKLTGGGNNILVSAGHNLKFQGTNATIGGTNSILALGNAGDTVTMNTASVTYMLPVITGNTSVTGTISEGGSLLSAKYLGIGANAVSASKLATARTISLTGALSGSGSFDGSGNLTISTTATHDHSRIIAIDDRTTAPSDFSNNSKEVQFLFTTRDNNNGTPYADAMVMSTYSDASGGSINMLLFDKSSDGVYHRRGTWNATSWGAARKLAYFDELNWSNISGTPSSYTPTAHDHDDRYYTETEINTMLAGKSDTSHNHDTRYVNKTGDSMSGKLGIVGTGTLLELLGDNVDILLRMGHTPSDYGFDFKYTGSETGANNSLELWTDGTGASGVATKIFRVQQDGIFRIEKSGASIAGNLIYHTGNKPTTTDIGAEPAFSKNTAFNKNFGTAAGTVAEGNHVHSLASLSDTTVTAPGNGQILKWNGSKWVNATIASADVPDGTTSAKGVVQLSTATNSTSTTLAATPSAVKEAMDIASAALARTGGTVTGPTTFSNDVNIGGFKMRHNTNSNSLQFVVI